MKEVLVPVDGSDNATRAARHGARLAKGLDAHLCLFYVLPAASNEIVGLASLTKEEIEQAVQSSARRAFDRIREDLGEELPAEVMEKTALGDPAMEILRYTEAHPESHVVMGRRGLSAMRSLLLGSVSDKVIRHATSPVTVVT